MSMLWRLLIFVVGVWFIAGTIFSAVRNFVVPRGESVRIGRFVFIFMRGVFKTIRTVTARTYEDHDRIMAEYAPFSLLMLPVVWMLLLIVGYTCILEAVQYNGWTDAFKMSGSSLFTLGFDEPGGNWGAIIGFSEAAIGVALVGLLVSYLPAIYAAFSRRESNVAMLEVRAGSPPSPVTFLVRMTRIDGLDSLPDFWRRWEEWFVEIEETHSSLSALVFFRSPDPYRSWVTASGVVLDSAALTLAVLDVESNASAALCIRSGFVALRKIGSFYRLPFDADPSPGDQTSILRSDFDEVVARLREGGVPIKDDLDQAWLDFNGWRVNYDDVLIGLASLVMAPEAPWITDRIDGYHERQKAAAGRKRIGLK